jgi:DNA polymerase I-like protein with 3'-5' exonuclease and polymerase domains
MALPKGKTFEDFDYNGLLTYAGVDSIVTLDILKSMWPTLTATPDYMEYFADGRRRAVKAPSIVSELVNTKAKALKFIVNMEVDGIPYDIAGNREMGGRMFEELGILEDKIYTGIGKQINLASSQEVGGLLYGTMGMECPLRTKSGDDSTSGDALKALAERYDHSWLKDMSRQKNIQSMFNGFIKTYVEDFVKKDGRVHPEYNLHGTSSHRISSDNPNLLNIPRFDSSDPYDIRSLYGYMPGYVFLTLDFSSCEVKVLAARCKDPTMMKAIREGYDFHTYTASIINKLSYQEMLHVLETKKDVLKADKELAKLHAHYKKLRQAAKAVTLDLRPMP